MAEEEFKWTFTELVKEWIFRRPIFLACWLFDLPEFIVEPDTLRARFLTWLYGPGAPEFDCWFPEDSDG